MVIKFSAKIFLIGRQLASFCEGKRFVFLVLLICTLYPFFYSKIAFAQAEPVQPVTLHNQEDRRVVLTPEERAWLAAHPDITFGYTDAFEPALIVNEDGSYRGSLVDFLDLLNQRLGTDFKITVGPIPDMFSQVSRKELAGILSLHPDNADKRDYLKTKPYMNSYPTVFARKGFSFKAPHDLAGKKIALIDNVYTSQNLVDLYGDGSELIKVKSGREGLEAVRKGNANLYIGSSRNSYLLGKYQFFDLVSSFQFYDHPTLNVMAVRNDWPQLVFILNKGLASISAEEIESLQRKWGIVPEQKKTIELTREEQAWLKANPTIKVGTFTLPPYTFVKNGRNQGYLIDMMQLLAGQAGFTPDFSINALPETFAKVKSGQLHAVLGIMRNEERAGFMYFSENVLKLQMAIFALTSRSDIRDAASLKNKIIATRKGYGFEHVIKKYLPDAKIIRADDAEGMLRLVAMGEADAAIRELHSGEYILQNSFMNNVNVKGFFTPPGLPETTGAEFAVSKKFPLLNSILNKAYDATPVNEKTRVWQKWFGSVESQEKTIELTEEEQAWLDHNHTVRVRAIDWPPYLIIKENQPPQGIAVEYLKLIKERTGINFEYAVTKQPFGDFLESMKQRQGPDMTLLLANMPEREEYLSFTEPYILTTSVVFAHEEDQLILDIKGLAGKSLAVPKGYNVQQSLAAEYPDIRLVLCDSELQALNAVVTGKADAYIGNLIVASHLINQHGLSGLKIIAPSPFPEQNFSMANRDDWPELTSIIDKVLANLTEKDKTAINSKYVAVRYETGISPAVVFQRILAVSGVSLGIVFLFVLWNFQLRRKVNIRTVDLEEEIVERIQAEEALRDSETKFRSLMEQAPLSIQIQNLDGQIIQVNKAFKKLWGISDEDLPEVLEKYNVLEDEQAKKLGLAPLIEKAFRGEVVILPEYEYNAASTMEDLEIGHVEDQPRWIQARLYPIRNIKGDIVSVVDIVEDITERKHAEEKVFHYQQRLKALASQLIIAEEKERSRIAADLHDHIGQTLAFSRIQVAKAKKYASEGKLAMVLDDISQSLLKTIQDTKDLVFELSSPLLYEFGLEAAIAHWLEENIARKHGLEFELVSERIKFPLSKDVKSILFRNVRELLTNVIRHAEASKVIVSLLNNKTELKIAVSDDGTGFDVHELREKKDNVKKFGLFSIRERMENMGGSWEIISEPGKGCKVILSIPLDSGDEQATVEI